MSIEHPGNNTHEVAERDRSGNVEKLEDLQGKLSALTELLKKDGEVSEEDRALIRELLPVAAKLQAKRFDELQQRKAA